MTRRLLVVGASGFIGGRLLEALSGRYDARGTCHSRPKAGLDALDLLEPAAVAALLDARRPEVVLNCAAMAGPDDCEKDPQAARRANVEAPLALARACAARGSRLVHLSTDLVFDGERGSYAEDDAAGPLSVYGRTKLEGERAVLSACPSAAVARVSLVYGLSLGKRAGFLDWLLGELAAGREAKLFTDQWRTPTAVGQLPELLSRLAESGAAGVFHCGGGERVNRLEFGRAVCRAFGLDAALLRPAEMAAFGGGATRPRDCSLRSDKLAALTGLRPWGLEEGLKAERARTAGRAA